MLSDLHLEHAPYAIAAAPADVIVLAGDVGAGTAGVEWARGWAGDVPVLYVAGNHEFYGHGLPSLVGALRERAAGSPVHVLEDDEVVIGGARFLGCSLWSDFEFDGLGRRRESMLLCERVVNDYRQIRLEEHAPATAGDQRPWPPPERSRPLTAADTLAVHRRSRAWLSERLAVPWDGPTVVVTHHAPVIRGRPEEPVARAIGGAFASDLTGLMGGDRAELWIFGHTHRTADLDVGGTRVLSNPRGYPHQPVDGFDPGLVVEVPDAVGARSRHVGRRGLTVA